MQLAVVALATLASFEAVLPLPLALQNLNESMESGSRLFGLAGEPAPNGIVGAETRPFPASHDIVVTHLAYRYGENGDFALRDISFTLAAGSHKAIVGPSGAGKSTLLSLLVGFRHATAGQIEIGGHNLNELDPEDLRRHIGVVEQNPYLFNTDIRENLLIARTTATEQEIIQAAQQAQLHDFIMSLPAGYATLVGEQGVLLSGGQRQRLAIARALLKNAPILLLDEATANLDAMTERGVMEAIRHLMHNRTTLVLTHRLVGLENMNEILVLKGGQIVERGTHNQLMNDSSLYRRMVTYQHDTLMANTRM
jgi:ATP-binding cassette subfamily C protein CydC